MINERTENMLDTSILVGKTIAKIEVDEFDVDIIFTDGTVFKYESSDGGYSCWNIYKSNDHAYDEE